MRPSEIVALDPIPALDAISRARKTWLWGRRWAALLHPSKPLLKQYRIGCCVLLSLGLPVRQIELHDTLIELWRWTSETVGVAAVVETLEVRILSCLALLLCDAPAKQKQDEKITHCFLPFISPPAASLFLV